jgi:hypothetical protein
MPGEVEVHRVHGHSGRRKADSLNDGYREITRLSGLVLSVGRGVCPVPGWQAVIDCGSGHTAFRASCAGAVVASRRWRSARSDFRLLIGANLHK